MRILIMRTFAHRRIWEGYEPWCHYEDDSYNYIKGWEQDISDLTEWEVEYGIGIYNQIYFDRLKRYGKYESKEETQPSLLKLKTRFNREIKIIEDNGSMMQFIFEKIKKYEEFNKNSMLELDKKLIKLKINEIGERPPTPFDSLCFSLDFKEVEKVFLDDYGVKLL